MFHKEIDEEFGKVRITYKDKKLTLYDETGDVETEIKSHNRNVKVTNGNINIDVTDGDINFNVTNGNINFHVLHGVISENVIP